MQHAVNDDTVQLIFNDHLILFSIDANTVDGNENISFDLSFGSGIVKSDNVSEVIVIQVSLVDLSQIRITAKNEVQVFRLLSFF